MRHFFETELAPKFLTFFHRRATLWEDAGPSHDAAASRSPQWDNNEPINK
jgi:hypothetical protein